MKVLSRLSTAVICLLCFFTLIVFSPPTAIAAKAAKKAEPAAAATEDKIEKPKAIFDVTKMSDMSDFDPTTSATPGTVKGDTIKIAYVNAFSGPAAANGPIHMMPLQFAAYDINKRGGIWVDGKKRLIEIIQADHMSKPDQCKKICERMILQEKVHVLMGTSGSNLQKIINEVANKYKVISVNEGAVADDLQDATNFGRYAFMVSPTTIKSAVGWPIFMARSEERKEILHPLPGLFFWPRDGRLVQDRLEGILSRGTNCRRRLPQAVPYGFRSLFGKDQILRR